MSFKRSNMPSKVSKREKAYLALVRRRVEIAKECQQLKVDIEFYNKNNPWGAVVDVPSFDFTAEVLNAKKKKQPSS